MEPLVTNRPDARRLSAEDSVTRRDALRLAAGLGLSFVLPGLDPRAAERRGKERPKSLITIWLAGGPSQLETWDPHPGTAIGGPTKAIPTKIPGVQIADLYPRTAENIHHLSLIRSMVSKEGDHERGTYFLKTGYRPAPALIHPSVGAVLVHELPNPHVEIPQHISLCPTRWPERGGYLGAEFDAFQVYNPGVNIPNMKSRAGSTARQRRRLKGLDVVSGALARGRQFQIKKTLHRETITGGLKMMASAQLKAFELKDEPKFLVAAYGDSTFGRGCLVARRLVEQGVRAVEVNLNGFDTHAANFSGHKTQADILDPALATLIGDLKQRDLLESTVLLCIGEFGRTPRINPADGRDHWPTGFSCLVGGGGIKGGQLIGETDPTGKQRTPKTPVHVNQLYATVFSALGVDHEKELITPIGRPMTFSDGKPIKRLL